MALYVVGDLQGCVDELNQLLDKVAFNPDRDQLWCVGDIVARGPSSLACLERLKQLGDAAQIVLGNHDLNLLAVLLGVRSAQPADRLEQLLELSPTEKSQWIDWLRHQPLLLRQHDLVMTHAGIYPWWTVPEAEAFAAEVEQQLQQLNHDELKLWLEQMYGNTPNKWSAQLQGAERTRFIVNAFTRMRYVNQQGELDFACKLPPNAAQAESPQLTPWFERWPHTEDTLIFGHWAALRGVTHREDVIGLDTGCVWGHELTLMRWPERQRYQQQQLSR